MKFAVRALCVFSVLLSVAQAAQDDDDDSLGGFVPRVEDELVVYVPKFAVRVGFREIEGAKASFGGTATLSSFQQLGDATGVQDRVYHDGYVALDQRKVADPSGNTVPITPDGRTNAWTMKSDLQATADEGYILMHGYTANVTDASFAKQDAGRAFGVELTVEREMGSLFHGRVKWGVVAGMGVNQIHVQASGHATATINTVTDTYSLGGQAAPTAPYTAPASSGGVDTSVLLGNEPLSRGETTTVGNKTAVTNFWRVRGAFMTFRAGPTVLVPIGSRFSASFSAGAAAVYAGTTYNVDATFKPETGDDISETVSDGASAILLGYYVDANVQWAMNETSGLYVGAVYQDTGGYDQDITNLTGTANYSTRVDLSKLQGVRAGVSFKF